jgi:hypothetical protein
MGVSVPDAAITVDGGETVWLSRYVDNAIHWSREHSNGIHAEQMGKIVALDAIIGNEDRNATNLLVQVQSGPHDLELLAIDHEQTWLRDHEALEDQGLRVPAASGYVLGVDVHAVVSGAGSVARDAVAFDHSILQDMILEAKSLAKSRCDEMVLGDALKARLAESVNVVAEFLTCLKQRECSRSESDG